MSSYIKYYIISSYIEGRTLNTEIVSSADIEQHRLATFSVPQRIERLHAFHWRAIFSLIWCMQ